MSNKYHHLTLEQRCHIFGLKSTKYSIRKIAKAIKVSPSTVSRELKRNKWHGVYKPEKAQAQYGFRRKNSAKPKIMTGALRGQILFGLSQYFSPEQIAGSLKKQGVKVSHETIYRFIWQDKSTGGTLFLRLRHKAKKYRKRRTVKAGRSLIPGRIDIDKRPAIVQEKSRIGDWEADTIVGPDSSAVVTLVDRCSKMALFAKVPRKTKTNVANTIIKLLAPYKDKVKTITFDNGMEFADHAIISKALRAKCYFAKPYRSWERGLNEHTNGLLRQFIPKKTPISNVSNKNIAKFQKLINNRPRKILNFNTPIQVFLNSNPVALRC
jgi:IS30 family transposase